MTTATTTTNNNNNAFTTPGENARMRVAGMPQILHMRALLRYP
jgi:hypothetical protein